ncbi:MAG: hypothetical protein KBE09_00420 [Candidatus Pacebacteria bacterium]|nr:hypothetical protein [Candidatus Paceibacterota bacterium]
MARYAHEISHARSVNPHEYVQKTSAALAERRAARVDIRATLDGYHDQLVAKRRAGRGSGRTALDAVPLKTDLFEPWEVASIIRLWTWERFHGYIGFESYEHRFRRIIFFW